MKIAVSIAPHVLLIGSVFFSGCAAHNEDTQSRNRPEALTGPYLFVEFSCADVRQVVVTASTLGNLKVDIDGAVEGKITLITPQPVDLQTFSKMFYLMLYEYGYATEVVDGVARVVPNAAHGPSHGRHSDSCEPANTITTLFAHALLDDSIFVVAHARDGQPIGFRVYPGPNIRKFNSFGLKSGDMIVEISGVPVSTREPIVGTYDRAAYSKVSDKAFEFLGYLEQRMPVNVSLIREGEIRNLEVRF